MKDKEKALEIANKQKKYYGNPQYEMRDENWSVHECYQSAMQAMKWKDEQLVIAAKDSFCEVCPFGPCPYPVDNGEECKRRFAFGEKIYKKIQ